jgi:UDP-N-acetylglucosamine transferase subunit ALG13
MLSLSEVYSLFEHFWITNSNTQTTSQLVDERAYFIETAHYKQPWSYCAQVPVVLTAFKKERPTHVLSTGSGRTAFIPFIVAKVLRIPFLHVDTFSRVHGFSKFGEFLLRIRHKIFCQWESPNPNTIYIGPIFKRQERVTKPGRPSHVFVTVGTRTEPFTRLLSAVDALVKDGSIADKVIVQAGHTRFTSPSLELFDFCSPAKIDELIVKARYVITQESAGIGTKCLKVDTPFIVMPRDYTHGELPSRSDMNEDLHLRLEELGYTKVVHDVTQLREAIRQIEAIRTGFTFDNTRAVTTLKNVLEAS